MKHRDRVYLAFFTAVFVLVVWVNANADEDIWQKSFQREDTRPYGAKVLFEVLPYIIDNNKLVSIDAPPYQVLSDTTLQGTNYLFITRLFAPDEVEAKALYKYASRGNVVFVSAEQFGGNLPQMLGIDVDIKMAKASPFDSTGVRFADSTRINLLDKRLAKENGYFYSIDLLQTVFSMGKERTDAASITAQEIDAEVVDPSVEDSLRYSFLGVFEEGGYNFLKIEVGEGYFLLSSVPLAFTNVNVLMEDNAEYVYRAFSYLPAQPTFWDRYYKPLKSAQQTPLRFILQAPALRAAYFLLLSTLLLFMLTHIRRKQRIIPVLTPRQNTTVEFTHTIGRLYYNQGDHDNLAKKMLDQFKHYVQFQLNLRFESLAGLSIEQVASRSGLDSCEIAPLFDCLKQVEENKQDAKSLQKLAGLLDNFYAQSSR